MNKDFSYNNFVSESKIYIMKKIILLYSIVLCALFSSAQNYNAVLVINDGMLGIMGADVTIGNQTITTDFWGEAWFSLPAGTYVYSVTANGYSSAQDTIEITNADVWEYVSLNINYGIQTISIPFGWSIISTYIDPIQSSLDSVFYSIINEVVIVKNESGLVYWPTYGINGIGNLTLGEAYLIKLNNSQTLDIVGSIIVPEQTTLNISSGWNLLGYLRTSPANIEILLSSIVNEIVLCKNGVGNIYWPIYGINTIGDMVPGEGYQIKVSTNLNYTYPANGPLSQTNKSHVQSHFQNQIINTDNNMTVCFPLNAWNEKPDIGSEIIVKTTTGNIVGTGIYKNENVAITIWGDDELSPQKDGIFSGESFSFMLYDPVSNELSPIVVDYWEEGNNQYSINKIAIIGSLKNVSTDFDYSLKQNIPNPAISKTRIDFRLAEKGHVKMSILNETGQLIDIIKNEKLNKGNHSVNIDIEKYPAGVYLYRLEHDSYTETRIMHILK